MTPPPKERPANRLAKESSPYLLQHARNPVDWYPWGEEAFAKAKREDRPVFLSIGYSTCHWCHVMERESFENDSIAELLNANFVSIKVDREERPDVDSVYMTAIQATGIDKSSEMLRLARVKLEAAGISSSLRQADMYALPLGDGSADSVVIHQVLHYAQNPAAALAEAARVLRPGGRLLVVDFAAHEREDLRSRDAHLRLGFSDEAMAGWFRAAGLEPDMTEHLPGGELTVTLWRGVKAGALDRKAA